MARKPQFLQRGVFLLLPIALIATACGSTLTAPSSTNTDGDTQPTIEAVETPTTDAQQMSTITVAARNSIESSPLWIADSLGLFEKRGIDIAFVPVTDESAVIEALTTNESRAGVLSSTSLIQGLQIADRSMLTPVVYIDGTDVQSDRSRGSLSLVAPVESGNVSGCDLEGQAVAVDSRQSAAAVALREMIIRDGCDPTLVEFLPIPQDEVLGALLAGDIVAAATLDPLTARLLLGPNAVVANLDHELCPDYGRCPLSVAVFQTDWADENPLLVRAFRDAMHEAMTWIRLNEIDYLAELVTCCAVTPEDAAGINVPRFVGDRRDLASDIARLQTVVNTQLNRVNEPDSATGDAAADGSAPDDADEGDS